MKKLLLLALLTATGLVCATGVGYDLRGEKSFQNEIDSHVCKQLYVDGRAVDWVVDVVSTSVGLIGKICKQEPAPYSEAVEPSATYGGTLKGWFIFDLTNGRRKPLNLPGLSDFSNPSFCNRLAAYWGTTNGVEYSLVLADLTTGKIVKNLPIGRLNLETDYVYHLAPATWSGDCNTATFADERYLKTTESLTESD
jgi:hypothetical protein